MKGNSVQDAHSNAPVEGGLDVDLIGGTATAIARAFRAWLGW